MGLSGARLCRIGPERARSPAGPRGRLSGRSGPDSAAAAIG